MQNKKVDSLAEFESAKVVSNHFAVVKQNGKYNVLFMRDSNSQNGELVFDDDQINEEEITFTYTEGEEAIIGRKSEGKYGYYGYNLLKGAKLVQDSLKYDDFFHSIVKIGNYYTFERFDETCGIMDINGNVDVIYSWYGDGEIRTIVDNWKNLYSIRMQNADGDIYYNVWDTDANEFLLSDCVDYLRFENKASEEHFIILIVDAHTIYLVDKNNKETGVCFPCKYDLNHIELQDRVTIDGKDYKTENLYDIVDILYEKANDNVNSSIIDELNELLTTKGCPMQIVIKTKQNFVGTYKDIHCVTISKVTGELNCVYGNKTEKEVLCELNDIDISSVRFIY